MSWDNEELMQPERFWPFSFYKTDGGNGTISESIAPGTRFRIQELRVHFSVAFVSTEYLVLRLSAAKGSAHNIVLLSYLASGSTDIILYYSEPRAFLSDDHLIVELSNASAVNVIGVNVIGWAVVG